MRIGLATDRVRRRQTSYNCNPEKGNTTKKRCSQLHRLRPKRCNQLHRLRPKTVQNAAPKRCSQLHTTTINITTIEKRETLHAQRSVKTDPIGNLNGDR